MADPNAAPAAPDYSPILAAAGAAYNVDPALLQAQMHVESGGDAGAVSPAGAVGLMQLMPATAKGLGVNPYDPTQSIWAAAKIMDGNLRQFGNPTDALRAYNAGPDQSRWNNPETAAYPAKVAAAYQVAQSGAPASAPPGSYAVAAGGQGDASDVAPNPAAPPSAPQAGGGRPSDGAMIAALTSQPGQGGAQAPSGAPPGPSGPGSPQAAPAASQAGPTARPDDATLARMLTAPQPAAAPPAATPPAYATVAPHPAPDGSGTTTNLSDADYARFTASLAASQSAPASPAAPQSPAPPAAPAGTGAQTPASPPSGSAAGAAFGGGMLAAGEGIVNSGERLAQYADQRVPFLAAIDQAASGIPGTGNLFRPAQATTQLDGEIAASDQANKGSLAYGGGKLAANLVATLPVTMAGGALVGGAARLAGLPSVANALAGAPALVRTAGNLLAGGASGAAQGAAAATIASGGSKDSFGHQVAQGAAFGGVLGAAAPAVVGAARSVGRTLLGGTTTADIANLAQLARDRYGIPITVGQLSENPLVRVADQYSKKVPLSGGAAQDAAQQTAFNKAVGQTIGLPNAPKITPYLAQQARDAIGAKLDNIAQQTTINVDQPLLNDLAQIHSDAPQSMTEAEANVVQRQVDNVMTAAANGNGTISGDVYHNLTKFGTPLAKAMGSQSSNIANGAGDVKEALAAAAQRSLQTAGRGDLVQQLSNARLQYKSLKTIEPLIEKSANGDISPALLLQQVRNKFGGMAYATPGGTAAPLVDLAHIGQQFLKEPGTSNTPAGLTVLQGLYNAGKLGAGVAMGVTHPGEAAMAAGAGVGAMGAARLTRAYLGSNALANRAIRNALTPSPGGGLTNALVSSAPVTLPAAANALAAPAPMNALSPVNPLLTREKRFSTE